MKLPSLGSVAKAVSALAAGASVMVTSGLLTGQTAVWVSTGISAVLTAVAAYTVENKKQP